MSSSANQYGLLDRMLHRLAFATRTSQVSLADLEDRLYADRLRDIDPSRPVFITALPRAGTTLLLNLLYKLPEFGSHCYRDMPFVLCPLMWDRFSTGFRQTDAPRERAHGDGMLVSVDSPESLEEVIWKFFWPSRYKADRIETWDDLDDPDFSRFLLNHLKKVIALRCQAQTTSGRYVSKNNLNIARLAGLSRWLTSSMVVVLYRDPWQQAASLLRQHRQFLALHAEDRFAKVYMAAIGHYDFGANLRPVNFDGWLDARHHEGMDSLGFWLEYWTACYRHLLREVNDRVHLVSFDRLCQSPAESLEHLGVLVQIEHRELFRASANSVRPAKPHNVSSQDVQPAVLEGARSVLQELNQAATI